jgi:Fe-S-cluster containining protein
MKSDLATQYAGCAYFFDDGLCFECLQCGDCCTGEPGTIYVSGTEIEAIAGHLQLTLDEFRTSYLYPYKDSFSVMEDHRGHCLFYDQGCTIYQWRPLQCRTFPFWFSNVRSETRWQRIAGQCPGIGRGRRYTRDEIMTIARSTIQI